MQLVSYHRESHDQLALLINGHLYNTDELHPDLPGSMGMFLNYWEDAFPLAKRAEEGVKAGRFLQNRGIPYDTVTILSPVPFPTSYRGAHAFRQHVAALGRSRNAPVAPEFDQYPVFYFGNHYSVQGPGEVQCMPDHLEKLDFALEAAVVVCKQGRNIPAALADEYIGGLMIMNGICARKLQSVEMPLNPGDVKGRDFSTALGPALITLDELEFLEIPAKTNHTGKCWNLVMKCRVNGELVSEGNLGDMDWTFAEIIERASYGANLYPGDIIGSGTVGTGCFLELNGTAKLSNPGYTEQWLQPGDTVQLEIDRLGILNNLIVRDEENWSILKQKKI
ncbi:fumarylacetoacetate hydrolase family protein [Agriterribacter sp.]|uniref:fumarylacetoacetate hydrolase family protein n=1 Tax=Agriterribacter sp. TaxID=2821509 RepID=UPI002D0012A8|nr:fumarylacetoacetate hydrolase family protein [Agriterribacter sp.]HRO44511.1 fumarylacetoacetate hydrolase family protein [Agriterribacter sp.]HRQ16463.1 fumarylacetoacetate hydrolase family protein [Agriterribacter sp.]